MLSAFAPLALAALVAANPVPQAVTSALSPSSSPPAGCSENYDGNFQIQTVKIQSKRDVTARDTALEITLKNGVLMDSDGRTGYIASNNQFQFDDPPQAGAIYTSGFSVCSNGSLAIGADTTWYACLSGTFYNLYDENSAAQCSPVHIQVYGSGSSGSATASGVASQIPDGQITASPVAPVTQISDGQPQAPTATPGCTEYKDGQPQCGSATIAPMTTATPACTEYKDGQPQCGKPTSAPVTTAAPTPACSEYKDGQPQCSGAVSTGMMPSYTANYTAPSSAPIQPATGGAASQTVSLLFAIAVGAIGVAML